MSMLLIVTEEPKTKRILIIFDPNILPTTNPASPFLSATIDVTNSGTLVPNATKETDMTIFGTLKNAAIPIAESINKFDP